MERVTLGNEVLLRDRADLVEGRRAGLITNASGVDSELVLTARRLRESDGITLSALFGPEHGISGDVADGKSVGAARQGSVPVHSLYGEVRRPTAEMLENVDVMFFDIQDVGARFYTFITTMAYAMASCAESGIPFVVLDRPNPIGGDVLEGNLLDPAFASFVGGYPILLRHGMTAGELAAYCNGEFGLGADLTVVEVEGWRREMRFRETGLSWVPPSPNIPTPEAAEVYPGTCLVEGTNISEGRGTPNPFELVGAPFIESERLSDLLNAAALPGTIFRPAWFTPAEGKHGGQRCGGIQVHVMDPHRCPAVQVGLAVLSAIRELYPASFAWRLLAGATVCHFDRLMGTDRVRHALDEGIPASEIVAGWRDEIDAFRERRKPYLLYP